ncbi:hypothetical protein KA005_45805 [bacterium]|nr:hypothetical protein [bacterium]
MKKDRIFKPLDMYGDWVNIPRIVWREGPQDVILREVRDTLREQIDAVIPRHALYLRCIRFQEKYMDETAHTSIAWLYCPDIRVIQHEVDAIIWRLNK